MCGNGCKNFVNKQVKRNGVLSAMERGGEGEGGRERERERGEGRESRDLLLAEGSYHGGLAGLAQHSACYST